MSLLLLTPRDDIHDTFKLADAAKSIGWEVERATTYQPTPEQYPRDDIVLYGETFFTTLVAQKLGYAVLEPPFDLLARIPQQLLSRNIQYTTLEVARQIPTAVFAKPADGNKAFESEVYMDGSRIPSRFLDKKLPVLVSTPVTWIVEYRLFVVEHQIATYSIYARNGQLAQDEQGNYIASEVENQAAVAFCQAMLQDSSVDLPPAVVLDVGLIEGIGWALIEPNPVSSSGTYGCDAQQVLKALQRACIKRNKVDPADEKWLVNRPL
jgi:hypothetical protein